MSIIRIKHDKNYVCLHKGALEDPSLSFKAKGLWAYCMSRPDDWNFHVSHLCTVSKESRTAVFSAIKELINCGYATRIQLRNNGRFESFDYEISELKKCLPHSGFPTPEKPNLEKPNLEKPPLLSKEKSIPSNECIKSKERKQTTESPEAGPRPSDPACVSFSPFVSIKEGEYRKLCEEHGKAQIDEVCQEINDYLSSTGKKPYKDYAATIRNWLRRKSQMRSSAPLVNRSSYQIDRRSRDKNGNLTNPEYGNLF